MSFVRKPLNLVLLVVLPLVVIVLYGEAMEAFSSLPLLSSLGADLGVIGRLTGALFATAFLTGIIGLFQVISARQGDERLVLCGFSRSTLLATRLVTVIGAAALTAGVSLSVLLVTVSVDTPLVAFGALFVGGVSYGLLGMLVGALLPRELEGSLVLVFLVDIDDAVSSGMFIASDATIPKLFPLYRPHAMLETAVLGGAVTTDYIFGAIIYLLVLTVLVFVVYVRVIGKRGDVA